MRELKNSMRKFLAAIFCLFMNLLPGKKFTKNKDLKETVGLNSGTFCKQNDRNEKMFLVRNGKAVGRYSCYLKEILEKFDKKKYSQKYLKKGYDVKFYADTG